MTIVSFTLLVGAASFAAGCIGALTGLGGGAVLVPLLTLAFGVNIHYAVGASLISVIATSSGAAAAFARDGYINIRVGLFLEIATTIGAVAGSALATALSPQVVSIIFGVVLIAAAMTSVSHADSLVPANAGHRLAARLRLSGQMPASAGGERYSVAGVPGGFGLMFVAGVLSSLLGIGAGAVKVLALDRVMRLPFKVSTTTSNFMIGVTAAAGAGVYLSRGYIDPGLTMPVMLGVLSGALVGAKLLIRSRPLILKRAFTVIILIMAIEMIYKGAGGLHV